MALSPFFRDLYRSPSQPGRKKIFFFLFVCSAASCLSVYLSVGVCLSICQPVVIFSSLPLSLPLSLSLFRASFLPFLFSPFFFPCSLFFTSLLSRPPH
ncbi:hypothetical protein BKA57DRAFT_79041 [Linnemannia elongata]|nr:hypothetical protein BKA57DRAFT_79041 [Linnemannia elongata]